MRLKTWMRDNWLWPLGLAVSVVVTFFSFPPHALGPVMFVGLVPVFMALEKAATWRQAAARAWLFVFLATAAVGSWIPAALAGFAGLSTAASVLGLVVAAAVGQLAFPLLAAARHVLHRRYGVRPLFWTPAAALALEVLVPKPLPVTLGAVLYRVPWLCQAADITGVWGLTALLLMTNELVAALALRSWPRRELVKHGLVSMGVLAAACAYGFWRQSDLAQVMAHPLSNLRVGLLQTNIDGPLRMRGAPYKNIELESIFNRLVLDTARMNGAQPDLVVWPEYALPELYLPAELDAPSGRVSSMLDGFILRQKNNLVLGAFDRVDGERVEALVNLRPYADKELTVARDIAHKAHVLPFIQLAGLETQAAGGGGRVLEGPASTKLGALIGQDGLYPRLARDEARLGAGILVNVASGAWSGDSREAELRLALSAFRSIETRRPLIYVTNTGYSSVIDINGVARLRSALNAEESIDDDLPLYAPIRSPFVILGDGLVALCGLYALAWLGWKARRAFTRPSRTSQA